MENKAKKMMILGASALQVPAIKKAKEMGYEIILIDYDENAVGFSLADVRLIVSTLDQEEVYRQALIYEPDVIITSTSDGPVRTAAYVNEKLGKRGDLSYEDSLCATIKSYMRNRLKENNVPIPEYYSVSDYEGFRDAAERLDWYCIVKPADNAGSRGVQLLSLQECENRDAKLESIYEYSKANSKNGIVMVEEFMSGAEVSVEAITIDCETHIITITDKYITPPPYFVELAHCEPSMLDENIQEQIKKVTLSAVKAIRLKNGASHTEIKITKDGPKVVELAARLGGDFITSRLVPLSSGVDMVGASVQLAVGEKPDIERKWNKGAAIHFIQAEEGIIKKITVPDEAYQIKGVEEIVIYKEEGSSMHGTRSSNDRLGHIITVANTPREAMEIGRRVLEMVVIEVSK